MIFFSRDIRTGHILSSHSKPPELYKFGTINRTDSGNLYATICVYRCVAICVVRKILILRNYSERRKSATNRIIKPFIRDCRFSWIIVLRNRNIFIVFLHKENHNEV